MKSILFAAILLAESNTDSCGTESPTGRENPDTQTQTQPAPAPSPRYSASEPAAEYEQQRNAKEGR